MVGDALETGRKCPTEKVVVSVNRHFVLELAVMKKGVGCSRVAVEGGHHKFSRELERGDSFDSGESEGLSALCFIPFGDCWLS